MKMMLDIASWGLKSSPAELFIAGILAVGILYLLLPGKHVFPLINNKNRFELCSSRVKKQYINEARKLIQAGLRKSDVFDILSDNGVKTVLAPKYASDIRSHPSLSFGSGIAQEFHSHIRGFEPFSEASNDQIFADTIRLKLTQSLGVLTKPLSDETSVVLEQEWSNNPDWHIMTLKSSILKIVAQLSSKVFLGDKICRNPDWLRITVNYTVDSFIAAMALRQWPQILRPLIAKFLPCCQKIRTELKEARAVISPVLEERRFTKEKARREGKQPERFNDAMEWMEEISKGRYYSPEYSQLSFSVAAIHTTSDMLTQVLFDLCDKEGLIQELREEVIAVIKEEGWKKTTLYKLKLMDSVLKESQRLKPINIASMRRLVLTDLSLSDGTIIPKNSFLVLSGEKMWDAETYPNPENFDPYRFLRLRETPGHETSAQLVSPSPEHLGFGYGKHACPGRFFAANEIKIALCHILLKYDFKFAPGSAKPKVQKNGFSLNVDPMASIAVRRRKEEILL